MKFYALAAGDNLEIRDKNEVGRDVGAYPAETCGTILESVVAGIRKQRRGCGMAAWVSERALRHV